MATTGVKYATTAANDTSSGTTSWASTSNATGSPDASNSTVALTSTISHYLKLTGYDFSAIPSGSTINGVTVTIRAKETSGEIELARCYLLDTAGAPAGTNKYGAVLQALTTSLADYVVGGSADLWGNSLTLAWVQDADFGVSIAASAPISATAEIDSVGVEINYTPPPMTYYVVYESTATDPADNSTGYGQIIAGQDGSGAAAVASGSIVAPTADATDSSLATITGLSASTAYTAAAVWWDGASDYGAGRVLSADITTDAAGVTLVIADASHAHAADNLALTLDTTLAVADASHAHAADSQTLTTASSLAVDDASHGHAADAPVLSTASVLAVSDATHAHTADALVLTTDSSLAVDDATHGHAAESLTLTLSGSETLVVADATHAHSADSPAPSTATGLTVADASHGHTADAPAPTTDTTLAVQEATHAHAADSLLLEVSGSTSLAIADSTHAHAADSLALTLDTHLTIADATHGHAADAPMLYTEWLLAVADAAHGHSADNLDLTEGAPTLAVADATHGHSADSFALMLDTWLTVADALHGHAADNAVLSAIDEDAPRMTAPPMRSITAGVDRMANVSSVSRPSNVSSVSRPSNLAGRGR